MHGSVANMVSGTLLPGRGWSRVFWNHSLPEPPLEREVLAELLGALDGSMALLAMAPAASGKRIVPGVAAMSQVRKQGHPPFC